MCTVDLTRRCKLLTFGFYICCFVIVNMPAIYVLWSLWRKGPSSISVPNFKWIALFVQKLTRGSQNLEIRSRDPGHLGVALYSVRWRGPSSISVPNLKWIAQFVQKLLRGSQNLGLRSRDPGHTHLGVALYSVRWRGPSSISVPNLKRIVPFFHKLLRGSQNLTPATPT